MSAPKRLSRSTPRQHGVVAVEFALLTLFIFLPVLLALFEVSRYMYLYNTMQEITRRAAREAVIRWRSSADTTAILNVAMFNSAQVPGTNANEITADNIEITYWNAESPSQQVTSFPSDAADNLSACNDALRKANCIAYVQVRMANVTFKPFIGDSKLFHSNLLNIPMPESTVMMYAESMGFTN